jgi:hypothetical protein
VNPPPDYLGDGIFARFLVSITILSLVVVTSLSVDFSNDDVNNIKNMY